VQSWVNGKEDGEFVGVGARFGPKIVSKEKHANRTKLTLADPMDCCSPPKHKVAFYPTTTSSYFSLSSNCLVILSAKCFILVLGFWRCSFSSKGQVQIHKESKVC